MTGELDDHNGSTKIGGMLDGFNLDYSGKVT